MNENNPCLALTRKDQPQARYVIDDVLSLVFYYLNYIFKKDFLADPKVIHSALSEMKEDNFSVLRNLNFSKDSIFPFSRKLEAAIDRLRISKIIILDGDFKIYKFNPEAIPYVKNEVIKGFSGEEINEMIIISKIFADKC